MLILTRKAKQKIIINKNIELIILKIRGKQVRIGIIAPPEVRVYRAERLDFSFTDKNLESVISSDRNN